LPDAWKIAKVTPIPKVSRFSNMDVSDLRPISVLSVVSKVMERIVTNRLMTVVEERGWLSDSQCGFRRRLSTLDNLSVLVDEVLKNWGERKPTCVAFLDIKTAYDSVNRRKLMERMEQLGVHGWQYAKLDSMLPSREDGTSVCQWSGWRDNRMDDDDDDDGLLGSSPKALILAKT